MLKEVIYSRRSHRSTKSIDYESSSDDSFMGSPRIITKYDLDFEEENFDRRHPFRA